MCAILRNFSLSVPLLKLSDGQTDTCMHEQRDGGAMKRFQKFGTYAIA